VANTILPACLTCSNALELEAEAEPHAATETSTATPDSKAAALRIT
jgi:hypothetical protein